MFKGSLPAMVTPFDNGEVDVKGLKNLVNWHIEQGSHGLVPVGTTGESPTLTHAEHEQVVSEVINEAAGRVPVIAGAGSNNTAEAIRFVEHAKNVGANAALVVTPYYNKPTQAGLIAHFTELAKIGLPIIIYNIPGRSVVDMSPETMGELAKLDEIVGVKDATGDLARVCDQRLSCGDDFIQEKPRPLTVSMPKEALVAFLLQLMSRQDYVRKCRKRPSKGITPWLLSFKIN